MSANSCTVKTRLNHIEFKLDEKYEQIYEFFTIFVVLSNVSFFGNSPLDFFHSAM